MTTPVERAADLIVATWNAQPDSDGLTHDDALPLAQALAGAGLLPDRHEYKARGGKLLHRYVTDWEEVPDDE